MLVSAQAKSNAFCQHRAPQRAACFYNRTLRPQSLATRRLRQHSIRKTPQASLLTRAVSPDSLNRALCEGSDWEQPAEGFNSISEALTDVAQGKFVVVLDDESRENEGDLIMAAETMTTEAMAFMVKYTSGVICVPLEGRYTFKWHAPRPEIPAWFLQWCTYCARWHACNSVCMSDCLMLQGLGQIANSSHGQLGRE